MNPAALCRDCLHDFAGTGRCPACGSPRTRAHPELRTLAIAHLDCDAFYAAVEKRDDPTLRDRPVIIGGGRRGVVSTACYIARIHGVRSAMPMFQALRLCPDAVVIKPRMAHYLAVSREIGSRMRALTPLVEPLSLDEAFLDLTGTERLHHAAPAWTLAKLQARIEAEVGITVSIGLSHNKFLAKIASELDKPRGFQLIGRAETLDFLGPKSVGLIWGVGKSALDALEREGLRTIADLRSRDRRALIARFGGLGDRLWHLAQGLDLRPVASRERVKSISHETTFRSDLRALADLKPILWHLAENVSARAKAKGMTGGVVALKLKRADHRLLTRRHSLDTPTQMADRIFRTALALLERDVARGPFRLIGVGLSALAASGAAQETGDLLDPQAERRLGAERARDAIRARYGDAAILLGRSLP